MASDLDALKKYLLPTGDEVSPGVLENDPELALPYATTTNEIQGNDRLKQMLGLGPSPLLQEQRKNVNATDEAINTARTEANPEVAAQTDLAQQRKMALAGEPNRVAGSNELAVQRLKQKPLEDLLSSGAGTPGASNTNAAFQFTPTITENGISLHGEQPAKLNQQEQMLVDSAHGITTLGQPLLEKFAAKYPGIDQNPQKYGNVLADTLAPKIGKAAYMFGGMTDNDALMQESAAIQAWGMRALMNGRMNQKMMDLISAHLPQPGFSAGANYDRLKRLMTDILPAQLEGINQGRGTGAMTLPTVQNQDPYADPNWGR